MKKIYRRLKHSIIVSLNNRSLLAKFAIIFFFSGLLPITLSCVIFSHSINRIFYEREMDNLNFKVSNEASDIKSIFDDAVAIGNVVASDNEILNIVDISFSNAVDYYDYLINHNLKDYYGVYVVQKPGVEDVRVYLNNESILNGGLIWRLTDREKENNWYQAIKMSKDNIVLCSDNSTRIIKDENSYTVDGLSFVHRMYRGYLGGEPQGYVKVKLNMARLRETMLNNIDHMSFYLINRENDFAYEPVQNYFYNELTDIEKIISDRDNIVIEMDFGRSSYLKNWSVVGIYDRKLISRAQYKNIALIVMLNLIVAVIMLLVVYSIYHSYNDRISRLIVSMKDIEEEKFNEIEGIQGTDEIGKLTSTYNHMVNKINVLINDVYKLEMTNKSIEIEKVRAELKYLQSQVDPHFIFNVLNAILVVSVKNGYSEITKQISGLAKMIRRLLDWSDDSEPLSTEIGFIEVYLQLEKFRFGEKFDYEINIKNNADKCNIPKMIVQPLVENACRHGLQGITEGRRLIIDADMKDKVLYISVKDNGKGISEGKLHEINGGLEQGEFEGHIGLKNVYRRLKLYFGECADMKILSEENHGTEIIIRIDYTDEDTV